MHPFMWRFWTKTPSNGRIAIYDGSWYRKVLIDRFDKKTTKKDLPNAFESIREFEEQLTDGGTVMIKFLMDIDKAEQKKRFHKLLASKETSWRVTPDDLKRNKQYERYQSIIEEALQKTDTDYAPWTIIEATDRRFATVKIYTKVVNMLSEAVEKKKI